MKNTITFIMSLLMCIILSSVSLAECRWDADAGVSADWDKYSYAIKIELYKGSIDYETNRVNSSNISAEKESRDFTQTIIDTGPGTYTYVLRNKEGSILDTSEPIQISDEYYTQLVLGNVLPVWQFSNNNWYLIDPLGNRLKGWHMVNEKWYYMSESTGICYLNRRTPDGYFVDETGAWDGNPSIYQ